VTAPILNDAGAVAYVHKLKCWAENFDAILDGRKRCEVRAEEDRKFAAGEILELVRTDHSGAILKPMVILRVEITHVERHAGPLELRGALIDESGAEGGARGPHMAVLSLMTNRMHKYTFPPAASS
jgi:hypothetical protein